MKQLSLIIITLVLAWIIGCGNSNKVGGDVISNNEQLKGSLIIFHAGSLSYPVKAICDSFGKKYPDVKIYTEAAGSKECARKISDLKKNCDIMLSADYKVIDNLLIPEWADWNLKFAANEMAIVFTEKSRYANEINRDNWHEILLRKDVVYGRSDPESDPCGVRAILTMLLADKYYNKPELSNRLKNKNTNYIRPKETDLIALLETGSLDYIFLYRSVAQQHKLKYILLPDEINLKNENFADLYASVSIETTGKKLGEKIIETGAPMVYGLTIPKSVKNYKLAVAFLTFFLDPSGGMAIIEASGQPSVVPASTGTYDKIPEELKLYAKPETQE